MRNTPQQDQFFKWVDSGQGHGILNAVAGSGKTTSILQALNYIDDEDSIVLCSFTKIIADELSRRVRAERFFNVKSATLNSLGWGLCKDNVQGVKLDQFKTDNILRFVLGSSLPDREFQNKVFAVIKGPMKRMVSLLKSYAIRPDAEDYSGWVIKLYNLHDIELPDGDSSQAQYARENFKRILRQVYKTSVEHLTDLDFDDQKFMPVYYGWRPVSPAWIIVDESQDLSACDLEFVSRFVGLYKSQPTRALFVGDPNQAIYGFRGSLSDSMDQIKKRFKCHEMPLSVCWRCPDKVLELAREICPVITGPSPNPKGDGIIDTVKTEEFLEQVKIGDYVLSRTTAPLVKRCLQLIRKKTPAKVKGKDVGKAILTLIELIQGRQKRTGLLTYEDFLPELQLYQSEQLHILERANREEAAAALSDKCESLEAFVLESSSFSELVANIEFIFADEGDDNKVVLFLSVHKVKGLQKPRVWILRPDQMPHPRAVNDEARRQELNIKYVALTRAEAELRFVLKEKDEK